MQRSKQFMRAKWIVWVPVLVALVLSGILVPAARAGSFHFNKPLAFEISSLDVNGSLVGTGNKMAKVTLTAIGTIKAICQNKGGQQAPGRNPIGFDVEASGIFWTNQNGHADVEVVAEDPTLSQLPISPTPKQAGCPNGNWKVVGTEETSTNWKAAYIRVEDEFGQLHEELSFKCTTFFTNGVSTGIKCDQI
jgi:hypothetical protein